MDIYAVDARYPSTPIPGGVTTVWVNAQDSISTVAARIVQAVQALPEAQRRIDLLILAGHGNSGFVQFGTGLTPHTARELAPVRRYMSHAPRRRQVEIHGCGVASATNILGPGSTINNPLCVPGRATPNSGPGYDLLLALARALGCCVRAGVNCEYAERNWQFEGPTVTMNPNGSSSVEFAHAT